MDALLTQAGVGPMFWAVLGMMSIVLMFAGLWLGNIIGRKTNTGIGAFFIHLLVTISVASGVIPLMMMLSAGDLLSAFDPALAADSLDEVNYMFEWMMQLLKIAGICSLAIVAYFIAGLVGIARGRS